MNAASCSLTDVQAAISGSAAGSTILVPGGSETWSSQLLITKPVILIGSNPTITLAGITPSGSQMDSSGHHIAYVPTSSTALQFRLSGFTFDAQNTQSTLHLGTPSASVISSNVRIDHNTFLNCYSASGINGWMQIAGQIWGCFDNNVCSGACHFDLYAHNTAADWALGYALGNAADFYFEDNTITTSWPNGVNSGGLGGRNTWRHNTITYTTDADMYPIFDAHGNQSSTHRGCMGTILHDNTISANYSRSGRLLLHRGGLALVYNNALTYGGGVDVYPYEELCDSGTDGGIYRYRPEGYFWSNTNGGSTLTTSAIVTPYNACGEYTIAEGTSFFWQRTPFTGAAGVGVGLRSARPASPSLTGVGYWATDESILYRWTGLAWETYYTPYTYPHPLQAGAPIGTPVLSVR